VLVAVLVSVLCVGIFIVVGVDDLALLLLSLSLLLSVFCWEHAVCLQRVEKHKEQTRGEADVKEGSFSSLCVFIGEAETEEEV
jgi:hypothetical protein